MKQKKRGIRCFVGMAAILLLTGLFCHIRAEAAQTLAAGSSVYFGNYVQDRVTDEDEIEILKQYDSEGAFTEDTLVLEGVHYVKDRYGYYFKDYPIEWQVLADEGDSYLLLSKNVLAWGPIRSANTFDAYKWDTSWDISEVRAWLNEDFYRRAFSAEEQAQIQVSHLVTGHIPEDKWGGIGDQKEIFTDDKVFLLSYDDVVNGTYGFSSSGAADTMRVAHATPYVMNSFYNFSGEFSDSACRWWLRSESKRVYGFLRHDYVNANGSAGDYFGTYDYGIRPAIRIRKDGSLPVEQPAAQGVNTQYKDSSIDLTAKVAKTFQHSLLGEFLLKGPLVKLGSMEFNVFSLECEVESPLDFGFGDLSVKYDEKERTVEVLAGYKDKTKSKLDKSDRDSREWKDSWNDVKSLVQAYGSNGSEAEGGVQNGFASVNNDLKKKTKRLMFETESKTAGYFKFEVDDAGNLTKLLEGGAIVEGSVGLKKKQFVYTVIYVQVGVKGGLEFKCQIDYSDGRTVPKSEIEGKLTPSVAVGADLAVVDVQGGLSGTLSGKLSFPWESAKKSAEAKIKGKIFLKMSTFIGLDAKYEKKFPYYLELWPDFGIQEEETKLSYTPGEPLTLQEMNALASMDVGRIDDSVLESLVSDHGKPQMLQLDNDDLLLTYVSDGQAEANGQSTLMYRVYRNGAWSKEEAVWQTGRMDTAAKLFRHDGTVYAIYQNSARPFTPESSNEDMAASMELYVARFDRETGRFDVPVKISAENSTYKYGFSLCEKAGNLTAVWAENSDRDVLLQSGTTSICMSSLEGDAWSRPSEYQSVKGTVSEVAYGVFAGKEKLAYVEDGMLFFNGKKYSGDAISQLQFVKDRLYYMNSGGGLSYISDMDGKVKRTGCAAGKNIVLDSAEGVYWIENDGFKSNVFYQSSEPESYPVQVTYEDGFIDGFAVCRSGERPLLVYTLQAVNEEEDDPYGGTILKSVELMEHCRLRIREVSYDVLAYHSGDDNTFVLSAVNEGTQPLHNITAHFSDIAGQEFAVVPVQDVIKPGEDTETILHVKVPSSFEKDCVVVTLTADEPLEEQAVYECQVQKDDADISIEKISASQVKITNTGKTPASQVELRLYDDNTSGRLLETYVVGTLGAGESRTMDVQKEYYMAAEDINTGKRYLYCSVSQNAAEYHLADNDVIFSEMEALMMGDVNSDRLINTKDATLILQKYAGRDVRINEQAADVNGDGKINTKDATLVLQKYAGRNVDF